MLARAGASPDELTLPLSQVSVTSKLSHTHMYMLSHTCACPTLIGAIYIYVHFEHMCTKMYHN